MRLNRLELGFFQLRRAHRFAQRCPCKFQVALGRNQLLLARGHIHLRRHPIRFHGQAGLHVIVHRIQQCRRSLLLVLGDIDRSLRVEHLLIRPDNAEHNLLIDSLRRRGRALLEQDPRGESLFAS